MANMEKTAKARVFMSGRSQHVTIPHPYRFRSSEVSIRRDSVNGDIILSEGPGPWSDVFTSLDAANVPGDFLSQADRDRRPPARRPALEELFAAKPALRKKRS
jgi:virulence-associated protein VagC